MQLILSDQAANVLEAALEETLSQLRTRIEQSDSDVDRARHERGATVIRKVLQQLGTRGLALIV